MVESEEGTMLRSTIFFKLEYLSSTIEKLDDYLK